MKQTLAHSAVVALLLFAGISLSTAQPPSITAFQADSNDVTNALNAVTIAHACVLYFC